jgi:hypothetical protein
MNELPIRWYKYNQDSGKFEPQTSEPPEDARLAIGVDPNSNEYDAGALVQFDGSPRWEAPLLNARQIEQVRAIAQEELVKAGVIQTGFKTGSKHE